MLRYFPKKNFNGFICKVAFFGSLYQLFSSGNFFLLSSFSSGILCSAFSILWCLPFFFWNQTHRFISVTLRHQLNQFPSHSPILEGHCQDWHLVAWGHIYTHLHTYTYTRIPSCSFTFTHTDIKAHGMVHTNTSRFTHEHTNTLKVVIHHITVL